MANTVSAKKQHRKSIRQRFVNLNNISKIKTYIKRLVALADVNKKEEARLLFPKVQSEIARGVKKKVLKKNTAARKISYLSRKLK